MDHEMNLRVITLLDLWDIFVKRLWIMVLVAVVAVTGLFAFTQITFVPRYESTATLYILRQDEVDGTNGSSDDFSLALKVVNDCNYLLKSHSVLDQVIQSLDLDLSYRALYDGISVVNPSDTRILEVTVEADSPAEAKRIVDEVCMIGTVKIEEAMGFQQVNLYEYGIMNEEPCNQIGIIAYALAAVVSAVLVYGVFLISFLLDDRIRTEEDIETYLHLSILGDIPNADEPKKKRYGYYKQPVYGKNTGRIGKEHKFGKS